MPFRSRRTGVLILFAVALGASLLLIATRLRVQTDLAAFMPQSHSARQQLVIGELKAGVASRYWLLAIDHAQPQALSEIGSRYAARLRASGRFARIFDGVPEIDAVSRDLLFRYRYLLDRADPAREFSVPTLRQGFTGLLSELQSPLSSLNQEQLVADPTGAFTRVAGSLGGGATLHTDANGMWCSPDGNTVFILAEAGSRAHGFAQQRELLHHLRRSFHSLGNTDGARLTITGPAFFTVVTESRVRRDVVRLSVAATLFVVLLLLFVYRSVRIVLLAAVPVAGGLLLAVASVAAVSGWVHGISLAFGTTLLGVALDYPIHLFSHARTGEDLTVTARRIWPTLRIGVITTMLGFAALTTAAFPGIQQLGIIAIAGLFGAILITRYVLPAFFSTVPMRHRGRFGGAVPSAHPASWALPVVYGLIAVLAAAAVLRSPHLWSNDLSALTPIPDQLKQQDRRLRAEMHLPEPRYLIVVAGKTPQAMLRREEQLEPVLSRAARDGLLRSSILAATIVPSARTQRARQRALPEPSVLAEAVSRARRGTIFRRGTFEPFVHDVAASARLKPLVPADLTTGLLADRLRGLIRTGADRQFLGLVRLVGVRDVAALQGRLRGLPTEGVTFLDMKAATEGIVRDYRREIVTRSFVVLALIVMTLLLGLRDIRRTVHVFAPVLASVLLATAVALFLGQGLTIFHVISLLLVVGIGVDYALFATQAFPDVDEMRETRRSLLVCALSTAGVFGILASSGIPVLKAIGITVATGTLGAYGLSMLLSAREGLREFSG